MLRPLATGPGDKSAERRIDLKGPFRPEPSSYMPFRSEKKTCTNGRRMVVDLGGLEGWRLASGTRA